MPHAFTYDAVSGMPDFTPLVLYQRLTLKYTAFFCYFLEYFFMRLVFLNVDKGDIFGAMSKFCKKSPAKQNKSGMFFYFLICILFLCGFSIL